MGDTPNYGDDVIPTRPTVREYNREYQRRYRGTETGRTARQKYVRSDRGQQAVRRANKTQADRQYLTRPFVAWDGEGINDDGPFRNGLRTHRYVLLANSRGDRISSRVGLRTVDCLELLLRGKRENPDAIHVVYGGGYDFNCWLADLTRDQLSAVYHPVDVRRGTKIGKYRILWRPGKFFRVSSGNTSVTVYDVLSFFQRKFVTACDEYLGDKWDGRDIVVRDKERRSDFRWDELSEVQAYNDLELARLVDLMTELRRRLDLVGLRPGRWDGPGAIAAALLTQKGIKGAKSIPGHTPERAAYAIRCAYAGGRFELVKFGTVPLLAYEYDVNSAYPYALQHVPCLAHGKWVRHDGDPGSREFALYHVRYRGPQDDKPGPLFRRNERGAITYPGAVTGWYWTPEVDAARDYCNIRGPRGGIGVRGKLTILECWEWQADPQGCAAAGHSPKPFDWIPGYYLKRQALKKAGDGAHVGIKLALNSLYGKLAQQIGWRTDDEGNVIIPPFHELAWAGYTTSTCRALVLRAAMQDLDAIIAFETDALFSSRPLTLDIGPGLGQWECTEFSSLAYAQSGTYFGTVKNEWCRYGKSVVRTRGVDLGTMSRQDFESAIRQPRADDQYMSARLTRYIGAGLALSQEWNDWRQWVASPKKVSAGPPETSKRIHYACRNCWSPREEAKGRRGIKPGVWHSTSCPESEAFDHSHEFPVEWVHGKSVMPELSELREGAYEEWDGME